MPLTIRVATKTDADLIASLSRQTFYETFAEQNTPENMEIFMTEVFTTEGLKAEVGGRDNIFLLAFNDDEVWGYARLRTNNQPPELGDVMAIEIARLYAIKKAIGKGVGRLLMLRCIEMAKELNKNVLWLGVWEKNERALNFYRQWGFEKFGSNIFQLGYDAQLDYLMKKNI